jgi:hypothetical protein
MRQSIGQLEVRLRFANPSPTSGWTGTHASILPLLPGTQEKTLMCAGTRGHWLQRETTSLGNLLAERLSDTAELTGGLTGRTSQLTVESGVGQDQQGGVGGTAVLVTCQ